MRIRSLWVDRHLLDPHCGGKGRISAFSSAGYCESELAGAFAAAPPRSFGCWRQPLAGATPLFAPGHAPYRIAIPIGDDLVVPNDAISCPCFSSAVSAFFAPACCLASDLAPRYLASGRADPLASALLGQRISASLFLGQTLSGAMCD